MKNILTTKKCISLLQTIATTDNQRNQLVYKLCDLTDKEIAVVDEMKKHLQRKHK